MVLIICLDFVKKKLYFHKVTVKFSFINLIYNIMLDNNKLNRRLKKIFNELKSKWKITLYRVAVESNIPHSSLKYMLDAKFEWKLNHLLSITDFLKRYGAKISLTDLLDFKNKKSLSQIMNMEKADFREAYYNKVHIFRVPPRIEKKPVDIKAETEGLIQEIAEVIKENSLFKNNKISVGLKVSGKNINYQKSISSVNGKISKK